MKRPTLRLLAVLGAPLCVAPQTRADQKSDFKSFGLYTDFATCFVCNGIDIDEGNMVNLTVDGLTEAFGNVTFDIGSFSDLRTSSRWMHVSVGGTRITPANSTGSPPNGEFFKTTGTNQCFCCTPNNTDQFTVSDTFFNARLTNGRITVAFRIPPSVDVQCMSVGCGNCASFPYKGQQIVTITWTPAPIECSPPDCNDGNPCTNDSCVSGVCEHTNNSNPCNDGSFCNGTDTCSGGSCSAHSGDPCASGQLCCESSDTCADECCNTAACDDGDPCTGIDACVGGICRVTFISDCNANDREDFCDIAEGTSPDCNVNGIPDECVGEEGLVALTGASFGCDDTLPRIRNNVLRLAFACDISVPVAGEVQIRELLAGGAFGTDISDKFTFSVEGDNVLRILEDEQGSMEVLSNQAWYGIRNFATWPGVDSFVMDYVVVYGDVNNSRFNDFGDLSDIQGSQGPAADDSRYDVNASGFVDFGDISDAFAFNGSFAPAKPAGHACTIP